MKYLGILTIYATLAIAGPASNCRQISFDDQIQKICKERDWEDAACTHQKSICEKAEKAGDELLKCLEIIRKDCNDDSECAGGHEGGFECLGLLPDASSPKTCHAISLKKQEKWEKEEQERKKEQWEKENQKICKERGWNDERCAAQKSNCKGYNFKDDNLHHCLRNIIRHCSSDSDCADGFSCDSWSDETGRRYCYPIRSEVPQ